MEENSSNRTGREQEIIEAAQKIFAEYGYKKTTMDDVALKLNITRSALYYYYRSKEELFTSVGEHDFRVYETMLKEAVENAQTTDERFIAFCRCFLPMRKKFRDVYKLTYDDVNFSVNTHKKFKNIINGIHKAIIVEILMKEKNISATGNLEYFAELLTYSIRGIVISSFNATIEQLESDILNMCSIFFQGLQGISSAVSNNTGKKCKK